MKKGGGKKRPGLSRASRPGNRQVAKPAVETLSLQEAMPESDPAYPVLAGILSLVPASRWTFARVGPGGNLVSLFGSHGYGQGLAGLEDELERQRSGASVGPRIAATLGPLDDFVSGMTLLFADARADFGILTLLRSAELGPFTSTEISMLTLSLDAASDRLSELRLQPPTKQTSIAAAKESRSTSEASDSAFYVLDHDLQIVLAWSSEEQRRIALTGLQTRIVERLPIVLENTVREMTAAWSSEIRQPAVARPVPFLVVRTQPMSGPAGLFIGVRIDRFQHANSLTGAASKFHITPREVQVLALLLDGNHLDQIAKHLYITSSTVQDHINSMLEKTASGNRSELIARVLGWDATPSSPLGVQAPG